LPETIAGNLAVQRRKAQTVDWFHVLLTYNRLRVILHGSVLVAGGTPRMAIHGTGGSWLKYGLDVQEEQLVSGMMPGQPGWGQDPRPALLYNGRSSQPLELPLPAGDQRQYYLGIRDAIRNQGTNPVSAAQAIAVMAVLEIAIESSNSGKALPLALTTAEEEAWRK
jgi:predicted dehydrogenase